MATQLKDFASIEAILSEMTLEEKAQMIQGGTPFRSAAMPKYGIPALYMIDTTTGLNLREFVGEALYGKLAAEAEAAGQPLDREKNGYMGGLLIALDALKKMMVERAKSGVQAQRQENGCYPPSIALACTWNPKLVEEDGRVVASELGSKGIDMILGPCMNIHRDPLCGRLAESYSEDPYLTGVMAAAMTKGIQSTGVLADLKHFAANSQEKDRMGVEEHIPERALREIYFPAFKRCVDAGAKTIMSAYNKVNGVPCAMNKWLLTDVLRREWGFDGFVVSDWGASYDVPTAIAAGTDLTMPGPLSVKKITEAVAQGRLKEEELDTAIRNILRVTLSSIPMTGTRPTFDLKDAYAVTEKAAQEGTVLLKNDGALPIPTDAKVAFYGKRRKKFVAIPASVAASTDLVTNPQDSVCALIGEENVLIGESVRNAAYRIVTVGADAAEGLDRMDMEMDADDRDALEQALSDAQAFGGKLILIVNSVGPVELSEYTERVNAIVCPFFGGMMSGKVTADILFGKVNPSGKLPLTWPKHYHDTPAYKNYGGENKEVWYGEGIYVGYRWYDARHIQPLFPFGHGLSFTTFEVTDVRVPESVRIEQEDVPVRVTVKNTGSIAGGEVIQIYVHDRSKAYDRPEKELKAFQKVFLQPGEEKTVELTLSRDAFAGYYLPRHEWMVQPGVFDILVGTSAEAICCRAETRIRIVDPFGISEKSGIGTIIKDRAAVRAINEAIEDDIEILAVVAINYAPDLSLAELWNGVNIQNAFRAKGWSEEEAAVRFQKICRELKELREAKV